MNRQALWMKNYELVKEYLRVNGDLDISHKYEINGYKIGYWLNEQRRLYNKGTLNKRRQELLEDLGIVWKKRDDSWSKNYNIVFEYYIKHGHIDIPRQTIIDGIRPKVWLNTQRCLYKAGKLSEEKRKLLEKIGIESSFKTDIDWMDYYKLLKDYYKEHGSLRIPVKYEVNGIKLKVWFDNQRRLYNHDKMSPERRELFDKLHIDSTLRKEWKRYYKILKRQYKKCGNGNVNSDAVIDGLNVGAWLNTQRIQYKNGRLSEDKIKLLNEINIDWSKQKTSKLNKKINNVELYKRVLEERASIILDQLKFEGYNKITPRKQKQITNEMIKRIWR